MANIWSFVMNLIQNCHKWKTSEEYLRNYTLLTPRFSLAIRLSSIFSCFTLPAGGGETASRNNSKTAIILLIVGKLDD